MIKFSINQFNLNSSFLRYSIIGLTGVCLDFSIFKLLLLVDLNLVYANAIGYLAGTFLTFVLNINFNFRVKSRYFKRFFWYLLIALSGLLASYYLINFINMAYSLSLTIAKIISLPFVLSYQFTLNYFITFTNSFKLDE